jgi:hypothetical protein
MGTPCAPRRAPRVARLSLIMLQQAGRVPHGPRPSEPVPQVFFARVLRSVEEETVAELFGRFGTVSQLNLFRAFQVRRRPRRATEPGPPRAPGATRPGLLPGLLARALKALRAAAPCRGWGARAPWASSFAPPLQSPRGTQGAPTSRGCGLATMLTAAEAAAAIEGLHECHVWPGMSQPMVRGAVAPVAPPATRPHTSATASCCEPALRAPGLPAPGARATRPNLHLGRGTSGDTLT